MRRSRGVISVKLFAEITGSDMDVWPPHYRRVFPTLRFSHSFSFGAEGRAIKSDFRVEHELVRIDHNSNMGWHVFAEIERTYDTIRHKIGMTISANLNGETVFDGCSVSWTV